MELGYTCTGAAGASVTKLLGPTKWTYYYLYNILDVFSRYSVGWMIAERESASLAEELIAATCVRQNIQPGQLTIHADRGSSMTSKPVALLMADLGVTKTHSRPHVSNDNPFSESQFKTLKYRPDYPERFGCQQDARTWAAEFFRWYNYEHHHSAIGLLTPADVHFGRAQTVLEQRQQVLHAAYLKNPERFVKGVSVPAQVSPAVWINPPRPTILLERSPIHRQILNQTTLIFQTSCLKSLTHTADSASTQSTRDSVAVVFQTFHRYAGVAIGEHLGYIFTSAWTILLCIAIIATRLVNPLFGWLGVVPAIGLLIGVFEETGLKAAGAINAISYILWSVWLIALGIALLLL